jgi:NitT/TauT family transport system substrate-binding protein
MTRQRQYLPVKALLTAALLWSCAPTPSPSLPATEAPSAEPQATATPEPPIRLKVAFSNFASNSPVYIAQQEGFFEDAGLEVEFVALASSNEMYPALAAGQVDVVPWTLSAALFNAAAEGINIKYVADKGYSSTDGCPADAWMASKQALAAGLSDLTSLKGISVAATRGSISEYSMDLMLAQGGLKSDDVEYIQINENAAKVEALRSGSVDLVPLGEPWITLALNTDAAELWVRYSDILPNQSLGFISYGPSILNENHEAGVRFMMAYLRGIEQFNQGKTDRNVELVSEFTKISADDLRGACWNSFKPDGIADQAGLLAYQQWLLSKGVLDKELPLEQFWTDEFVLEAAQRLGR